jgi:hypothetical protein
MGNLVTLLNEFMKIGSTVGILRATTEDEERVTFVGNAEATTKMAISGTASNPDGIAIPMSEFPVILTGWPYGLRDSDGSYEYPSASSTHSVRGSFMLEEYGCL